MKAAGTVILEIAALCAIGGVLGLSVNALREKDSIRIGRNYFAPAVVAIPQPSPSMTRSDSPAAIPTTKAQADQWFVTIEEVRQLLEAPGAVDSGLFPWPEDAAWRPRSNAAARSSPA